MESSESVVETTKVAVTAAMNKGKSATYSGDYQAWTAATMSTNSRLRWW
jgi:hypothetical protein